MRDRPTVSTLCRAVALDVGWRLAQNGRGMHLRTLSLSSTLSEDADWRLLRAVPVRMGLHEVYDASWGYMACIANHCRALRRACVAVGTHAV